MINQEKENKLSELAKNEEFLEKLANTKNKEEAKALLSENGVELTSDEMEELLAGGKDLLEKEGFLTAEGELSEKGLELVSGGVNWKYIGVGLVVAGISGVAGFGGGVVIGAVIVTVGIIS